MKLSEMNTEQMADALIELTVPMSNIGKDDELNKELAALSKNRGGTQLQQTISIFTPLVLTLLKRHREDTYHVLSVLTGKAIDEIASQNGMQTIRDARDCVDKELIGFFR